MKPSLCKIEIDYDKKVIHWGDLFTQEMYIRGLDWRYVSKTLGFNHNLKYSGVFDNGVWRRKTPCGAKENNQKLTELLGISPKKFAYMLKGSQYSLWIKGKEDLISKLCIRLGRYSPKEIQTLNLNYNIVKQYQKDRIDNLLPLAYKIGKFPNEIKKDVGKATWKKICCNTFSRNKLICQQVGDFDYKEALPILVDIPTSLFRNRSYIYNPSLDHNASFFVIDNLRKRKRLVKAPRYFHNLNSLYYDTEKMAKDLERPFNSKWSKKRMEEMHDKYTKEYHAMKYSDNYIECLRDIPVKEMHRYNLTAKLLTSKLQIHLQGEDQRHCVGSYASNVKRGQYLVYDIWDNKKDERVSTLGINIRYTNRNISITPKENLKYHSYYDIKSCKLFLYKVKEREFTFSQHYMKFNKSVSNFETNSSSITNNLFETSYTGQPKNRLEFIAEDIIDELNDKMYDTNELDKVG